MTTAAAARDLLAYLDESPTPFHCAAETARQLTEAGFHERDEADAWAPAARERCFTRRGDGSLVAWRLGHAAPKNAGFAVIGAHTDSPGLRLKPQPARRRLDYLQLEVDVYGGALLATWADRDLSVAGRLVVERDRERDGERGGALESLLVRLDGPICRIPNVAIHLNRGVNDAGLVLNPHTHLPPVAGLWTDALDRTGALEARLAAKVGVSPDAILGHDLCLYDTQPSTLAGLEREFVHAARLDDQAMCHAALSALLDAPDDVERTAVIALFDHEEIGSGSHRGAEGPFLADVLARLAGPEPEALPRAIARSLLLSADMAHAAHPNYADLHDGSHQPVLNAGPVIKTNARQRYATDAATSARFRQICKGAGVPFQEFVNRPDLACGGTIGPISAARLGIPTVDVGNPMWSMHSIREMAGAADHAHMIRAMTAFFGDATTLSMGPSL